MKINDFFFALFFPFTLVFNFMANGYEGERGIMQQRQEKRPLLPKTESTYDSEKYETIVSALNSLGFPKTTAKSKADELIRENPDADYEQIIKLALKRN